MRQMSFSKTLEQMREGKKDVTRRMHSSLEPGEHFTAIEKGLGLKKGERVKPIYQCICISNEPEPLKDIILRPMRYDDAKSRYFEYRRETDREGFPLLSGKEFVDMFCKMNHTRKRPCTPETEIFRIVFRRYVS